MVKSALRAFTRRGPSIGAGPLIPLRVVAALLQGYSSLLFFIGFSLGGFWSFSDPAGLVEWSIQAVFATIFLAGIASTVLLLWADTRWGALLQIVGIAAFLLAFAFQAPEWWTTGFIGCLPGLTGAALGWPVRRPARPEET